MPNALRQFKASIFSALAHPTRIAIVELLCEEELSVGAIFEKLNIEQANASQHLAALRAKKIVHTRKEGNQVFYSLASPRLAEVLDSMRRYFDEHLEESLGTLLSLQNQALSEPQNLSSISSSPHSKSKPHAPERVPASPSSPSLGKSETPS